MTRSRLLLALTVAGSCALSAQSKPAAPAKPLTTTDLALAYARAMPFKTFLATDTTKAALWAAAQERTAASVAVVVKDTPPPAGVWRLLVVAENSCSDALASLPYIARLVDQLPGSELRIIRKADAQPLIDAHLFRGRSATPLVIVLDSAFRERGVWIERASHIQQYVTDNEKSMPDDSIWAHVRVMRKDDDGRTPLREVIAIMRDAKAAPVKAKKAAKPAVEPPKPSRKVVEPCKVP